MDYPTTISRCEDAITSWRNSGLKYDYAVLILTKHMKILMAYCSRRIDLEKKSKKAKTSYWRRQCEEAMTQLDEFVMDYLKIMNDRSSEEQIARTGYIGGCYE